jgi:acyl carrier protein
MKINEIENIVVSLFNEKDALNNISFDTDIFDLGVSSLTVVDLQIRVEEILKLKASTSELMRQPTINGWINIYDKIGQESLVAN